MGPRLTRPADQFLAVASKRLVDVKGMSFGKSRNDIADITIQLTRQFDQFVTCQKLSNDNKTVSEASAIGQLRENHRCEVVEDARAPGLTRHRKLLRAAGDLLRIDASQNLGEDSGTGVHATSATAAEVPGKIESRTSSKSLYHIIICR